MCDCARILAIIAIYASMGEISQVPTPGDYGVEHSIGNRGFTIFTVSEDESITSLQKQ